MRVETLENPGPVARFFFGKHFRCAPDDLLKPVDPAVAGEELAAVANRYFESEKFLFQYREVECEEGDCPAMDEVSLAGVQCLVPERQNPVRMPSVLWGGDGNCFPAETFVRTAAENLLPLGTLGTMAASGQALPEIASYDERARAVVYQQPSKVIAHGVVDSAVLFLNVRDAIGRSVTLRVTAEHPLLVNRQGRTDWVAAGLLADGDLLVGPDGGSSTVDRSATTVIQGAFDLYNLSFASPDGVLEPTYLVSPDGETWFVAHNVKLR